MIGSQTTTRISQSLTEESVITFRRNHLSMPELSFARVARLVMALGLSSGLSVALSITRMLRNHSLAYAFLNWNLVLAWVPLVFAIAFALYAQKKSPSRLVLVTLLGAWFVFFPNAPYLVTDLIHLVHEDPRGVMPDVYDSVLFFSFAFSGLLTGFLSLRLVEEHVRRRWGLVASWATVALTLTASGFGVYLGRFERFNSWDVIARPAVLLHGLAHVTHYGPLLVTFLFSVFLGVAYVTVTQVSVALRADGLAKAEGDPTNVA